MKLRLVVGLTCLLLACAGRAPNAQAEDAREPTLRERIAARRAARNAGAPPANPSPAGPGTYAFKLEHAGDLRLYRVHVPRSYDAARPTPVVVSFHGGGGSAEAMADDRYYGLIGKSEEAGFIAIFPNGYSRFRDGKLATFNAGLCCGSAREKNIDDVGFVRKVLAEVSTRLNVDPRRISATGMSNGGMMSYRLACEAADLFHAIAAVAGTDGMDSCRPSRPVSVLHIHARDDDHVLFNGGAGNRSRTLADFRSVPDTVARWVGFNGCQPTPKKVLDLPGAAGCELYTGCQEGVEVKLCVTETGGHSWPGGAKVRTGEPGSTAFDATDMIWDFVDGR